MSMHLTTDDLKAISDLLDEKIDTKIENKFNTKLSEFEIKIDQRFKSFEQRINQIFLDLEAKFDQKFIEFEIRFDKKLKALRSNIYLDIADFIERNISTMLDNHEKRLNKIEKNLRSV